MTIKTYRALLVWQAGMKLARDVYKAAAQFPKWETFALASQLRRAATSIPSNIAEGHGRRSTAELLRSIMIALGSVAELETQVLLAKEFGYVGDGEANGLLAQADEVGRMLRGLHTKLELRRRSLATSH